MAEEGDNKADTSLLCAVCFLPFDLHARKPMSMPSCIHTVCEQCVAHAEANPAPRPSPLWKPAKRPATPPRPPLSPSARNLRRRRGGGSESGSGSESQSDSESESESESDSDSETGSDRGSNPSLHRPSSNASDSNSGVPPSPSLPQGESKAEDKEDDEGEKQEEEGFACPVCHQAGPAGLSAAGLSANLPILSAIVWGNHGHGHGHGHGHDEGGGEGEREGEGGEHAALAEVELRVCQACEDERHAATHHCSDCDEKMCATAAKFHALYKPGTHAITSLPPLHPTAGLLLTPSLCAAHGQPVLYVCEQDAARACAQCVCTLHKGHSLVSPLEESELRVAELRSLVDAVQTKARELGAGAEDVRKQRDEVFAAVRRVEAEVNEYFDQLLAHRDALLRKLDRAKKAISQQHVDLLTVSRALVHSARHANRVLERSASSRAEVVSTALQLRQQLRLCQQSVAAAPCVSTNVRFTHTLANVDMLMARCEVVVPRLFGDPMPMVWDVERSHPNRRDGIDGATVRVRTREDFLYTLGSVTLRGGSGTKYQFTLRVDDVEDEYDLVVGVVRADVLGSDVGNCHDPQHAWVWCAYGNDANEDGEGVGGFLDTPTNGSEIRVQVDTTAGVVAFLLDGAQVGALSYPPHLDVVPAVGLYYEGSQVTLMSSGAYE